MARNSYRNFLRLLEKWPVDASKGADRLAEEQSLVKQKLFRGNAVAFDRDLGEYLRKRVTESFKHGEASAVNEEECHRIYSSLNRIASGTYAAKYPRSLTSTSTGLSAEECHQVMSKEFLNAVEEQDKGIIKRLFQKN